MHHRVKEDPRAAADWLESPSPHAQPNLPVCRPTAAQGTPGHVLGHPHVQGLEMGTAPHNSALCAPCGASYRVLHRKLLVLLHPQDDCRFSEQHVMAYIGERTHSWSQDVSVVLVQAWQHAWPGLLAAVLLGVPVVDSTWLGVCGSQPLWEGGLPFMPDSIQVLLPSPPDRMEHQRSGQQPPHFSPSLLKTAGQHPRLEGIGFELARCGDEAAAALQSCIICLGGSVVVVQAASCREEGADLQAAPSHGLVICNGGGGPSWTPERLTVAIATCDWASIQQAHAASEAAWEATRRQWCSTFLSQSQSWDLASTRCVTLGTSTQHVDQHTVIRDGLAAASAEDALGMSATVLADTPAARSLTDVREQEWDSIHASVLREAPRSTRDAHKVPTPDVRLSYCAGTYIARGTRNTPQQHLPTGSLRTPDSGSSIHPVKPATSQALVGHAQEQQLKPANHASDLSIPH
ncbi:MAG: hypothetical protein WDW38_011156 [Sanguina aurantia]